MGRQATPGAQRMPSAGLPYFPEALPYSPYGSGREHAGLPALPSPAGRAPDRAGPAAHLRGALQGPRGPLRQRADRVRHRLRAGRRHPGGGRLRVRDRGGPRAFRRRPAEPRGPRDAPVPVEVEQDVFAYPAGDVAFLDDEPEPAAAPLRRGDPCGLRGARPPGHRPRARARRDRGHDRVRDGGDRRVQRRGQAAAAGGALGDRAARAAAAAPARRVRKLDYMERAQARARSNGKVRLGPGAIPPPADIE